MALSHWYGWTDLPVFRFDTVNVNAVTVPGVTANDSLILGLTDGAILGLPTGSNIENPRCGDGAERRHRSGCSGWLCPGD